MSKENPHENHRSRMRARLLSEGLDSFADHNVIEYLLFESIPLRDTNELAHRLLNEFGSLSAVLDAEINDLCAVNGIGVRSALQIRFSQQLSRRYMLDKFWHGRLVLDTQSKIGQYLSMLYLNDTVEVSRILLLNADFSLIACDKLSSGSVNSTTVTSGSVIRSAVSHKASMVVLAHNHPGGKAEASEADIMTTRFLEQALSYAEINLLEHFVIAGGKWTSIMAKLPDTRERVRGNSVLSQFYAGFEEE